MLQCASVDSFSLMNDGGYSVQVGEQVQTYDVWTGR